MSSLSIFISYSHKDEEWKDRIVTHLRVLEMEGMLDVWDDRRIEAGDDWHVEIDNAINGASIAILIVSANFLTSRFILDDEVPKLLERRIKAGVRVIPVIAKPCAWTQVKWLSQIQARPKDGKPLSSGSEHQIDSDISELANEIAGIIKRAGITPDSKKFIPLPPDQISLAKLPSTSPDLFGRDSILKELDKAWENLHVNIFSIVAWGGVGKSALVNKWLSQMAPENYRGAERVFGWSFYSQGATEGRQVSADQFIASALAWFGDSDPNIGSPWDKGERLAELVKQSRTLVILDGLEPLQNPPSVETGRIKDPALVAFLRELARQNRGLIVITTRLAVDDIKDCIGDTVIEHDLENLTDEAGAAYLSHLGVDGMEDERKQASHEFSGHALALTLMGSYLKVVYRGDIRKRKEIPRVMDERKQGSHAKRVMASYETFLKDKPELDILRLMGLFDRPAEKGALDALRKEPVIEGLTDTLQKMSDADLKYAINDLRDLRLIVQEDPHEPDTLDCHPLLREHFGAQLKEANPVTWREGNNRLYEWYKASAKEFPDTLQEMASLYAAVLHGCQAGRYQEAFNVYWERIQRGDKYFHLRELGAYGADLSAISGFFDSLWLYPVKSLDEERLSLVLAIAGYDLSALGRLSESAQPTQAALKIVISSQDWINSTRYAINLSQLYQKIGNLPESLHYARQSVVFADNSGDTKHRRGCRANLAYTLFFSGDYSEAEEIFQQAEEIQRVKEMGFPILYGGEGSFYCDLLLSQNKYKEVLDRATRTLKWAKQYLSLLDVALDNLTLGRALLLQSHLEPNHAFTESLTYLNRAVDGLRESGNQDYLPRGLLERAEYYCVTEALDKAQKDLDEAFTIATRGGMGLYLADCHLEYARLFLAKGEKEKAQKNWVTAKEKIEKMGYHRRDKDVTNLEAKLK